MTCVSLRSGMASSGMFSRAHQPPSAAAATSKKTRNRLRAENSMIVLIMVRSRPHSCFQLALRINEKVSGGDDPLAGFEPAQDLNASIGFGADFHFARLEIAVAAIDKHRLLVA